jgi:hypothetical protein
VTVTNSGGAPLAIVGLDRQGPGAGAYAVDSSFLGRLLAPGAAAALGVTFTPTVMGPATGTLSVATNARTSPDVVGLTGTGVMPVLRVSQDSLGFGPQPVGLTGVRTLLLQNTGNAPLQIGNIAFAGPNAADFALAGGTPTSLTLQSGDMTLLNIEFSPADTGSRSARLIVSDDANGNPHSVLLAGTGTEPLFTLSAAALIFHIPAPGAVSTPQTVTFSNHGDAPLAIEGVALTGADASRFRIVSDSGEKRLDPGASRTVQISLNGATVASVNGRAHIAGARIASVGYSATLEIRHNDPHPGSPHQVALTALPAGQAAPAAPTGLSARAASAQQIDLSWSDRSDNEQAFAIWRREGTGDWHRVGVVLPNATRFADRGLLPGKAYRYRVRATTGNFASPWSNEVTATTLPPPPATPDHLVATVRSSAQVDLSWTAGGGGETGVSIFRRIGTGDWQRIGVVAPTTTRYADRSAKAGTSYIYRLRTHNSTLVSAWTNEVSANTPSAPSPLRSVRAFWQTVGSPHGAQRGATRIGVLFRTTPSISVPGLITM